MNDRCRHYEIEITRWLDEDLSSQEVDALKSHLGNCPSCQRQAERLKELRRDWTFPAPLISTATDRESILEAALQQQTRTVSESNPLFTRLKQLIEKPFFLNAATVCGIIAIVLVSIDLQRQVSTATIPADWSNSVPVYSRTEYESTVTGKKSSVQTDIELPMTR
jgi:anti-sigma factor RsiW